VSTLVYVEFISRRPSVSLSHFQYIMARGQSGWAEGHAGDRLLLNVGRTWRLGPDPEYLAVWLTEEARLDHLYEWERDFTSHAVDDVEIPFEVVARIDAAGCYRTYREIPEVTDDRFYVEHIDLAEDVSATDVDTAAEKRGVETGAPLLLIAHRIGHLAPHGGVVVHSLPDYGVLEQLSTHRLPTDAVAVASAGVYAPVGQEIL
jgi:hypothetical protein